MLKYTENTIPLVPILVESVRINLIVLPNKQRNKPHITVHKMNQQCCTDFHSWVSAFFSENS